MSFQPFLLFVIFLNFSIVTIALWITLPKSELVGIVFFKYLLINLIPSAIALYLLPQIALSPIKRILKLLNNETPTNLDDSQNPKLIFNEFNEIESLILNRTDKLNKLIENKRIMALAFQARQPILILDDNLKILKANSAFIQDFGYQLEEILGKTPKLFSSGIHKKEYWDNFYRTLEVQGHISDIFWNKIKSGKTIPFQANINFLSDDLGNPTYFICTYFDITKEVENSKKLQKFAYSDALTGLHNRRFIEDELVNSISRAKRHNHHGAILFMDLNKFKSINDTLGHEVGDLLLKEVAERLKNLTRLGELCCRLGGDEFLVVLPQLSPSTSKAEAEALAAAKRFQDFLSKSYKLKGLDLNIGVSIGISIFPDKNKGPNELLTLADKEMYKSKQSPEAKISIHRSS